ncbi:Mitochondrial glycine transporter [Araneus ventricosus]|uniref:Mitochondrial glycine transporter n=1 Tax=Araneus ventricosus TaxID=182803 RepID=A0A4Y2R997_ARAVE|nr:Mitochondrial glycine transporter [Araneus ventricosus]GBN72283.1 Mitochondrial glycine transporter [Araneus ventricosus]
MCHIDDGDHIVNGSTMEVIQTYPFLKSFLAGSVSGTCSTLLFQPLDLIKTRLQNASKNGANRHGIYPLVVQVLKNEKMIGLWRGTLPSIMRCVPGVGMYFSSLHWLQTNYGSEDPSPVESICFGVLARSFAGATLLPVTVLKTRYESGVYAYNSLSEALCKIYRLEGRKGLFSGLVPTLLRDAPFSGIYLMFYTQTKKMVPSSVRENVLNVPINFGCGVVAGILASAITQPADVIKTKMQLYPQKYNTAPVAVTLVFKDNGFRGFFIGMVPRVVRRTLMAAMAWTVYEQVIRYAGLK